MLKNGNRIDNVKALTIEILGQLVSVANYIDIRPCKNVKTNIFRIRKSFTRVRYSGNFAAANLKNPDTFQISNFR